MGTKLPRKLVQKMSIVGEQIKLARLRRNLSVAQVAERATCSPLTVSRIEKGTPTVAIGIYLRVLYALQLDDDILWLAKEDKLGKSFARFEFENKEKELQKRNRAHVLLYISCNLLFGNKKIWLKNLCYAIKALCLRCIINKIYEIR